MAKKNWYFDGYEASVTTDKNGREKKTLVYTGAWYGLGLPEEKYKKLKLTYLLLGLGYTVLLLLLSFFPTAGGMSKWVGLWTMLCLVPLMFFWMGLVNFLMAGMLWETRRLYAGYRRLTRWTYVAAATTALAFVCELVYIIMHFDRWLSELYYLAGILACLMMMLAFVILLRRHPSKGIKGADIK